MVKNEQDVIEIFVRHHLQFVDAMLIIDNDSTDGTREVLAELSREGLPVVVFDDPRTGYIQSERMTRLNDNAMRFFDPAHVLLLDADEFLRVESRSKLEQALSTVQDGCYGTIPWQTYVLRPEDVAADEGGTCVERMKWRRAVEKPLHSKAVVSARPNVRMTIGQGNHKIRTRLPKLRPHPLAGLALAHYPVRSFEQLKRKALFGWLAYLAKNPDAARSNQASQWRDLFDLLVSGSISAEHVSRISINYAQDRDLLADVNDVELVRDPIHSPVSPRHEPVSRSEPLIEAAKAVRGVVAGLRARKRRWPVWRKRRAGGSRRHDEKLFLDFPPFKFLWDHYRPASVLDLGCGPGGYVRQFQHWGCSRVLGVEGPGFDEKVLVSPESFRSHDLREPLNLGEMFDLVLCVEVIEHLDATHEAVLLESIIRHARDRILFSSADMDQPGVGHMNCRPQSHWLAQFERAGFVPACFESLAFRSLATFKWLRRNPILLLRSESASSQGVFGREDLDRIVSRPVD